ncbi:TPA: hypothetical protein DEF17_04150 [bacterium]|nr:MAG: hypothetical protein COS94_10100 [Candidatus Hydrogenedentes bacterium CG07_land_8_20_14_0_80_42_17]HBW47109.1 hypothetical protein [bacterium]
MKLLNSSMTIIALYLFLTGATSNPVVVPGPICAPLDKNISAPRDAMTLDGSGYFEPICETSISGDMLFNFNSYRLKRGSAPIIENWYKLIVASNSKFYIDGHTDSIGSDLYNFKLSQRRAETVRNELIKMGISPDRLTARGFGESKPIANNDTDAGRSRNRRAEIIPSDK